MREQLSQAALGAVYNRLIVESNDDHEENEEDGDRNQEEDEPAAERDGAAAVRRRPPSHVRSFFERATIGEGDATREVWRCKLAADAIGMSHPEHLSVGAGELKSMKRHIQSNFHKKALLRFKQNVDAGVDVDVAVQRTIAAFSAEKVVEGPLDKHVKRAKTSWSSSDQTLRRELAWLCFAITSDMPLRAAEDSYLAVYHKLSNNAAPPPSRRRISDKLLPLLYDMVQRHRDIDLQSVDFFSISTDGWTNDYGEQYIAVNASYITPVDFKLCTTLLDMVELPERHTWCHVAHKVAVVLEEKMPPSAVLTTSVTDNAATMLKAAAALSFGLDEMAIDNMADPTQWLAPNQDGIDPTALWACVDHKAQLAALDVLGTDGTATAPGTVLALYARLRATVRHIRQSPKLTHDLRHRCKELGLEFTKPILDVKTRWLSMWMMGDSAYKIHLAVLRMAAFGAFDDNRKYGDLELLTPREWAKILRYTALLEPIADFVRTCEGERYVTIAAVPVLFLRARAAMTVSQADDADVRLLKNRLLNAWDDRLGFLTTRPNLALVGAALHPQYGHLRFVTPAVQQQVADAIAKWGFEFHQLKPAAAAAAQPLARAASSSVQPVAVRATVSAQTFREEYDSLFRHFSADLPNDVRNGNNLALAHHTDMDVLAWWKVQSTGDLRRLATFARIILAVPATSALSERTFSRSGRLSRDRGRLASHKLSMLTVISGYLAQLARDHVGLPGQSDEDRRIAAGELFLEFCLNTMAGR